LAVLPLPKDFNANESEILIKDGVLYKAAGKFKVHFTVSIRKKYALPASSFVDVSPSFESIVPSPPGPSTLEIISNKMSKKKRQKLRRKARNRNTPNGFLPFKYEEGRGLPSSLQSITNFGMNILWRKNTNFVASENQKVLGVISLDPGIKNFLTGVSECGDEFLFFPSSTGYFNRLQSKRSKLQSKMDLVKNEDSKVVELRTELEAIKNQYYQEIRNSNLTRNWLDEIAQAQKKIDIRLKILDYPEIQSEIDKTLYRKRRGVKKLHNLCALFLSHWKFVILPEFSLNDFAQSKTIGKESKSLLATLSHGAFRVKLKRQLSMRGNCLLNAGEDWSTKLCHNCCHLNYPRLGRTYSCSNCKLKVRRDTNGAANILSFTLARILLWKRQKLSSRIHPNVSKYTF